MSIFIGSNADETIEPASVSSSVKVIGNPKTPSAAFDHIVAGGGNDRVAGGGGNDIANLGAGDDLFTWNSGDGSDVVHGGSGTDTLAFNGSAAAETIRISGGSFGTVRVSNNVENANMTLDSMERIVVSAGAGDDVVDASGLPAGLAALEIFGGVGADTLIGGAGSDILNGGDGNDQMFGGAGNDRMVWNPGDDSDLMEGGEGEDIAEVNGGSGAEVFSVAANGARVRFDRVEPLPFSLDIGTTENLHVNMNGGDDSFSAAGTLSSLIRITVDGGAGDDTILGSDGADLLFGGADNDFIDGQQGADVAFLGAGDDTFQWDPGDGSDRVEGEAGVDTMLFNGAGGPEIFTASADGEGVLFTRNAGNIVMDLNEVERIDLNAVGNADRVIVNDLSGTDLVEVNVNLAGTLGGSAGDGATDQVLVNGTGSDDLVRIEGDTSGVSIFGLAAEVNITGAEGALDELRVAAGDGADLIDATGVQAGSIRLVLDGGDGDDILIGGEGDDVLIGGGGNDIFDAGPGDNVVIEDFTTGEDTIDLTDVAGADGFEWVLSHARDVGGSAVIDFGDGEQMTLENVSVASLHADDFLLA